MDDVLGWRWRPSLPVGSLQPASILVEGERATQIEAPFPVPATDGNMSNLPACLLACLLALNNEGIRNNKSWL